MRSSYLIASVGARLINVVFLLILAYLMPVSEFGKFTLIYTNALVVQMLLGSWLVSITNRALVSENNIVELTLISAIASAASYIFFAILCVAILYSIFNPDNALKAFATAALAVSLIVHDTTLAVKNAVGREASYARLALYRNVLSLILSLSLVLAGLGLFGPILGMAIGTTAPTVLIPSVRAIWIQARPSYAALKRLRRYLTFGMAGAVVLGIYILVHAPTRNIIAQGFGTASAGAWTLSADLFFGPLAVIVNAYALSQIRLINLAAEADDADTLRLRSRALMEFTLAIAIPYGIGGILFAEDAMKLALPEAQAALSAPIAAMAAIQGAILTVLYSLASVALARRCFGLVMMMVATTSLTSALLAIAGDTFSEMASFAVVGSFTMVTFWLFWTVGLQFVELRWKELGKLAISVATLGVAGTMGLGLFRFPGGWAVAALAASVGFASVAIGLRLHGFMDALPPALRRRLGYLDEQVET